MPNGTRRGGTYTRNGKTYYRRAAKISPAQSYRRWGFGGTDLAGLGGFLTVCEVTLKLGWNAGLAAWRGGRHVHGLMADKQRADAKPKVVHNVNEPKQPKPPPPPPPPSPLVFTLEQDQLNGWRKGDVQCKVHHSQRVKNCKGCNVAMRHQRWVEQTRDGR